MHFKEVFKRLEENKKKLQSANDNRSLGNAFYLFPSHSCVDHTPKLKLWMAAMRKDPAVSALLMEPKALRGFLNLYLQNSPEACDYGL